ncbi:restriction endonuclease subunit S [Streptococcus suis]|uniref:Type I restriction-modification system S protein n=1 Tax=Streptococcus suis TaxID=1307 RepID=A0A123SGR5_STRSU|nr:restriction endonuclease subunit S [Streptococcus suis]MCK4068851.1 restriction endonuclease subunit S [Streptococcus suis]NQI11489.1 restriction endonuclease subunit S [Streptococcus suis]CYU16965.1 type I restriction-modification system S protein [Streptococcus suis]
MTKEKSTVPRLRFPGFTDAWKQRKLGEVAEMYSGGTPSVGRKDYYAGGIPFIRSAEINSDTTELYLTELGLNNSSAKMVSKGSLLYALYGATSGEVGLSRLDGAINQAILAILPNDDLTTEFLMYWLRREKSTIVEKYLQGGQGNLSAGIVKQLAPTLPTLPEQEAIGSFFSDLDQLITLHQRKLDEVKELKKALLQKMFPKGNGNDFPELRFPGFTDAWKQRKLGEVAVVVMGQSPDSKNYTNNPLDNILVQGNADLKNGNVEPRVWTTQITKIAEKGDIIVSVRAPVGDVAKTSYKVVLGRGVAGIKGNDFIYQTLIRMKQFGYWMKLSTGSTFESINSGDIKSSLIPLPSLPEQEAIGNFFSDLDQLITLHQRQLDHLKLLKKALLQQMFI